jgi:hypothetical protein
MLVSVPVVAAVIVRVGSVLVMRMGVGRGAGGAEVVDELHAHST